MAELTPYHWLAGLATVLALLGIVLRWHHRREATTMQTQSLSARMNRMEGKVEGQAKELHALELKVAEQYIHRDDFVVAFTRTDHKIDKVLQHLAGT